MKIKKFVFPGILLILAGAGIWWFLAPSNLPGEKVVELARDHIKDSDPDPEYNSNPPTSGPHSAVWTAPGFYESEKSDRNLIHSLEHGYVVVSYNCSVKETSYKKKFSIFPAAAGSRLGGDNSQFSIDHGILSEYACGFGF